MRPLDAILFLAGIVFLTGGASFLVQGATGLARRAGIPRIVVGLTVVALGTSAPEIAVSLDAALSGVTGVAVGNVVGSNIFNVLAILGLSAVVAPLVVSSRLVRLDVPLMIGASAMLLWLVWDGQLARTEGLLLSAMGVAYLALLLLHRGASSSEEANGADPGEDAGGNVALDGAKVVGGLVLLVFGSSWLVGSAVRFATALGVSDIVIGLTVVAAGTSLPEAATSLLAAVRGEREVAVGNVVGSNLLNLFLVLGPTAAIAEGGLPVASEVRAFDLPVMIATAFACLPIFFTGYRISRWEGGVFLTYYGVYTLFLVLQTTAHETVEILGTVALAFVLPITFLTLAVLAARQWSGGRR